MNGKLNRAMLGEREGKRGNRKARRAKGQKGTTVAKMAEFYGEEQLRKATQGEFKAVGRVS